MRLFVSIQLSSEIRAELLRLQRAADRRAAEVRWLKEEQLHLTLKFLGETEESRTAQITEALAAAAQKHLAFQVSLAGAGCFPPKGRVRIVWVGLAAADDALPRLAADLEAETARLGFPEKRRPFSPHITIGRAPKDGARASARDAAAELKPAPLRQRVASLHLMASSLNPAGAEYRVVKEIRLQTD